MICSQMFIGLTKIVITSKISIWGKWNLGDIKKLVVHNTINTIKISNKISAFLLGLVLQKTVDDIVTTWCCIS